MYRLTDRHAWQILESQRDVMAKQHMRDLFASDKNRFTNFSLTFENLFFDYSKNLITTGIMKTLISLAKEANVQGFIKNMKLGKVVNISEMRPALHTALRATHNLSERTFQSNFGSQIDTELKRICILSNKIRNGLWDGSDIKKITDVISLGIGGSHLGAELVVDALSQNTNAAPKLHFIANPGNIEIKNKLKNLNAETTLIIIISKTFSTLETVSNAQVFYQWLKIKLGEQKASRHLIAVTSSKSKALKFGVNTENIFNIWEWVGGRFSLWSSAGIPIALALGFDQFEKLLLGAQKMDEHFFETPFEKNLPIIFALISIWNINFLGISSNVILPYDTRLRCLPNYLQQLEMESNGKNIDIYGRAISHKTAPIIFGQAGTQAQHAFFQLMHQGTETISSDFLVCAERTKSQNDDDNQLAAHAFAQSEILMTGQSKNDVQKELLKDGIPDHRLKELLPHKVISGNKPSNTLLYHHLDAETLGMLLALYEHKVVVQGNIWQINPFDQWGVETGKKLTQKLLKKFDQKHQKKSSVSSTAGLILNYLNMREK